MSTLNIHNSLKIVIFSLILFISTTQMSYSASLNLAWDANAEGDLAGYKAYYGTSSGNYGTPIDVENVTEYELSGLTEGDTYYIAITAYDTSDNESEKSVEVSGVAQSSPDTQDPTITITSPTSSPTYDTSNSTINIGGTASDNVGVTSVTWTNNRGGSGSASGTTNWSVSNITLQEGNNKITVTARDAAGNTGTDNITVNYNKDPTITITAPTSSSSYSTENGSITVSGTASDNVGVTSVTWSNNRGGSGTASGTTNWSVSTITLQEGDNIITVTARDASGNTDTDTINITYTPPPTSTTSTIISSSTTTTLVSTTTTAPVTTTTITPEYTLTVNIIGSGNVTLDPDGGTYDDGTPVTLTAEADSGWVLSGWSGNLIGSDNPATITMNSDKSVAATFKEDFDNDGISDEEEDTGPNGGDGNYDLIPDSEQDNVASLLTYDGQSYVTLASPDTTTLNDVQVVGNPSPTDTPAGIDFPYVFFEFTIEGVEFGGATTVTLFLPSGAAPNTYYKYGPTPDNPTPHWYTFMYDGQTGAEINDNVVTLYFVDGQWGDDDLTANGTIVEPGGPGKIVTQPTTTTTTAPTTTTTISPDPGPGPDPGPTSTTTTPVTTTTTPSSTTTTVVSTTTTIPTDKTPLTGTITINNGDNVTYSSNVILTLFATDSSEELSGEGMMKFSNDSKEWSDPEPYTTTKTWDLSPGEGDKNVFVKFRDAAGNWMNEPTKDQIRFEESEDPCDSPYKLEQVSVIASSEFLPPFWAKDNAVDGNLFTFWSTLPTLFWQNEFITLDLGEIKQVSRIEMYASKLFGIDFFPVDFRIEISRDNLNWEEIHTEKNYNFQGAGSASWDLNSQEARYLRVYITKAKTFFILHLAQIAEIEVYGCDLPEENLSPYDKSLIDDKTPPDYDQEETDETPDTNKTLTVPGKPAITFN